MRIEYSVSQWNYYHYAEVLSLERAVALVREQGYGVELWNVWGEEKDLFDEIGRKRLKPIVEAMTVSLHTAGVDGFESHTKQIDAAAELGAGIIVLHPGDLAGADKTTLDAGLAAETVGYAQERGVRLALENGPLPFLVEAASRVEGLGICLDVGHVYFTPDPLRSYLDALKERIIHVHIQDILPQAEDALPHTGKDHYIPGTGGIPQQDWELVAAALREIDFEGIAVFEIQPRNPLQTALLGRRFFEGLLEC